MKATSPGQSTTPVHVAAAVLSDADGRVLLSRRPRDAHQGGLWEFPGGKVTAGEEVERALGRELREELGVVVEAARPLIKVAHRYPDCSVLLDVWKVSAWRGEPAGLEGQQIEWVWPEDLAERDFPAADAPVIAAVRLPETYAITPDNLPPERVLYGIRHITQQGVRLIQLRAHGLDPSALAALARAAADICRRSGAELMVNGDPDLALEAGAHGVHLTSARLSALAERPLGPGFRVGASCHDAHELGRAARIGADFAVLSPVKVTPSHARAKPLGWTGFSELVSRARLPVYALGGVGPRDLSDAWRHGGQGVAGIRAFWPDAGT